MRGVGGQEGLLTVPWPGRLAFSCGRHSAGGCCGSSAPSPSSAAMHTCIHCIKPESSILSCRANVLTSQSMMYHIRTQYRPWEGERAVGKTEDWLNISLKAMSCPAWRQYTCSQGRPMLRHTQRGVGERGRGGGASGEGGKERINRCLMYTAYHLDMLAVHA